MKLHLSVNQSPLNGYLNLDTKPIKPDKQPTFTGTFTDLYDMIEQSECTEILADNILDYIISKDVYSTLEYWVKLLRHGGTLIIG